MGCGVVGMFEWTTKAQGAAATRQHPCLAAGLGGIPVRVKGGWAGAGLQTTCWGQNRPGK